MVHRFRPITAAFSAILLIAPLSAATVSRQHAEAFQKKIAEIQKQGDASRPAARRTRLTEDEVNSWFAYSAQPHLPNGVSQPQVTIVGQGKVMGQAVVDLEAVAKRRATGGTFDPWSLVGGKVPVSVTGLLHTRDGVGRLDVQSAAVSGIPVPITFLQEIVSYYSRTPERPQGVRLDNQFALPAKIKQIEVGQGQAVVVQ